MNDLANVPERGPSAQQPEEPSAENGAADFLEDISEAQAHCPHCLEPVNPEQYYCPKCNQAISGLVGILPFVNIPFQVNFFGAAWRRMWAERTSLSMRVLCALVVLLFAPIALLAALPSRVLCALVLFLFAAILLWHKPFSRRSRQHGA